VTLSEKAVVRAVRKSILAVLSGDRPRDWEDSLADAADALADLLMGGRRMMDRSKEAL
jgi:hypothetical protein